MNDINLDSKGGFSGIVGILLDTIRWGIDLLDHIKLGSFSLLDLGLGILIMGLIISITLSTVKNYADNTGRVANDALHKKHKSNNNNNSNSGN